jgi:hypothetical protein
MGLLQLFAEHKVRTISFLKMAVFTNLPLATSFLLQILRERHRSIRNADSQCLTKSHFLISDGLMGNHVMFCIKSLLLTEDISGRSKIFVGYSFMYITLRYEA